MISGVKISGGKYTGTTSLETIGTEIFHFDYRYNSQVTSGRLDFWGDLSVNGFTLLPSVAANKLYAMADGFGDNGTGAGATNYATPKAPLNVLHNGSPYLQWAVVYLGALAGVNFIVGGTNFSGNAGQIFQVLCTTGAFSLQVQDGAGASLGNNNTAGGSVPTGRFVLLMRKYYGSGTGASNAKMYIENNVTNFTYNPAFSTNDAKRLVVSKVSGVSVDFRIKAFGAYDLTGKSIAQIDAFQTLFLSTLKQDAEYSSLTTP